MIEHFQDTQLDQSAYNKDLLFAITDNAADGVIVVDGTGRIMLANKAACVIFGYFPTQLIGKKMSMLLALATSDTGCADEKIDIRKLVSSGVREAGGVGRDGALIPLELNVSAVSLNDHETIFIATLRDVTDRIAAERTLRQQALIIEQIKDGILVADMDRKVMNCNAVLGELVGKEVPAIIGHRVYDIVEATLPEGATMETMRSDAIENGFWNGLVKIINAQERELWIDVTLTPQFDRRGNIDAFISVWRNVTERRETELLAARSERIESLGRVAGGVAHDINNLLFPMFLCLDEVFMDLAEFEQSDQVQEVRDRILDVISVGIGIKEVVQNIMIYSHDESGEEMDLETYQLFSELWKLANLCIPSSVTTATDLTEESGEIRGTKTAVSQILVNLVSNAVDAVDLVKGKIKVSTKIVEGKNEQKPRLFSLNDQRYILLTVEDNGHGIPEKIQEKIFDPFFTTKDVGEGSGIGMSQVSQIAQNLGGAINIRSSEDEGTTFFIYFPLL